MIILCNIATQEMCQNKPYDNKQNIMQYLSSHPYIASSPGIPHDRFTGERIGGAFDWYSDGDYMWSTETIFNIDKYNLKLPNEFLQRVTNHIT